MIKVHIISGFLGSGKTTFIKKLLTTFPKCKNVILENEFGEASIDGDIVKKDGYDVIELPSGCICCSLKIDFTNAIKEIIDNINPDNIIIEPTGLGLLSGILDILNTPQFKKKCIVENSVTIIDGENYLEEEDVFGEFFKDQIINAKTLFISKVENISVEDLDKIVQSLRKLNSRANIIYERLQNLSIENLNLLLSGRELECEELEQIYMDSKKEAQEEIKDFSSISIEVKNQYSKEKLINKLNYLKSCKLGCIYRAKGIVSSEKGSLEFNYVNGKFMVTESEISPTNKICIIGKELNKSRIKMIFSNQEVKLYGK